MGRIFAPRGFLVESKSGYQASWFCSGEKCLFSYCSGIATCVQPGTARCIRQVLDRSFTLKMASGGAFKTSVSNVSSRPVSYTHLDVYKRQPLSCSSLYNMHECEINSNSRD